MKSQYSIEDGEVDGLNQGVSPRHKDDGTGIFEDECSSNEDEYDFADPDEDDDSCQQVDED